MDGEDPFMAFNAATIPGKNMIGLKRRFNLLQEDVKNIESGRVPLPHYENDEPAFAGAVATPGGSGAPVGLGDGDRRRRERERPDRQEKHQGARREDLRAGAPQGHPLDRGGAPPVFVGADEMGPGKGDWRSISRNFVVSRTPTQVASHAQKYFIRLNSMNKKDKRRSSIHDITSVAGAGSGNGAGAVGNSRTRGAEPQTRRKTRRKTGGVLRAKRVRGGAGDDALVRAAVAHVNGDHFFISLLKRRARFFYDRDARAETGLRARLTKAIL